MTTCRTAAMGALGVLLVAACGSGDVGGASTAPSERTVTGTAVLLSDVSGLPDVPDPGGWVVTFPVERIPEVVGLAGDERTEDDLPYSSFAMSVRAAHGFGGTVAEVDGAARFRLRESGDVLVCRLVQHRSSGAVGARGCMRTVLPAGGVVRVSHGEAGMRVVDATGD